MANERAGGPTGSVTVCPACSTRNRVPADAAGTPRCAKCHSALPWLADGGDATYDAVVARSPLPVLVDLWAPWCGPCRMVSPAVEQVGRDLAGQLKVVKINVDDNPRSAARFDAMSIPTLVIVDHGTVVDRQVGAVPASTLRTWVDRTLATAGNGSGKTT